MALNPFVWDKPLDGIGQTMGRDVFADEMANLVRAGTNLCLLGPRGTGKTTFTWQLQEALGRVDESEPDQVSMSMVYLDFDHAFSWEALAVSLTDAADTMADGPIRRRMQLAMRSLETEQGLTLARLGAQLGGTRRSKRGAPDASAYRQIIKSLLRSIAQAGVPVLVAIDEFQRLAAWSEADRLELTGMIRSALMGRGASHVSMLFTGSQRAGLELLLASDRAPIFESTHLVELPRLEAETVIEQLQLACAATGKPMTFDAANEIVSLARLHPRRTQQLAWHVWNTGAAGEQLTDEHVRGAYDRLIAATAQDIAETVKAVGMVEDRLRRVLYMVADNDGRSLTSDILAERYGMGASGRQTIVRDLRRLVAMALVEVTQTSEFEPAVHHRITDPFLDAWLREHSPYR